MEESEFLPLCGLLAVFAYDLDQADDVVVQCVKFLSGYPPFSVMSAANFLDVVTIHKRASDTEPRDISDSIVLHVPSGGDFNRILLVRNRVENRLLRQARWPATEAVGADKFEFLRSCGSIKQGGVFHLLLAAKGGLTCLGKCTWLRGCLRLAQVADDE